MDYSGRGELAARQQSLAQTLSKLIKIAEEFNVAVYLTNQVVSDPGGGSMFISDPKERLTSTHRLLTSFRNQSAATSLLMLPRLVSA